MKLRASIERALKDVHIESGRKDQYESVVDRILAEVRKDFPEKKLEGLIGELTERKDAHEECGDESEADYLIHIISLVNDLRI